MSLIELHFEKKITVELDFRRSIPRIYPEEINNRISQQEFDKIWLLLKQSTDNQLRKSRIAFKFGIAIFAALLLLAFLSFLHVIAGKKIILMTLFIYTVILGTFAVLQTKKRTEIREDVISRINEKELAPKGLQLRVRTEEYQDYKSQATLRHKYLDIFIVSNEHFGSDGEPLILLS